MEVTASSKRGAEAVVNGARVSGSHDDYVLEMDVSNGCSALQMNLMQLLYIITDDLKGECYMYCLRQGFAKLPGLGLMLLCIVLY